jgi:superfamily II helicase
LSESARNLIGYCGLYCGACGIYQGRIKYAVENLQKVIGTYGFDKIMPELAKWEPSFQYYPEFEKVMDGLVKLFGTCPGCVAGGGNPSCAIRDCCKQKSHAICAECAEMETCEKLKRYNSQTLVNLRKVKAMGVDKWVEEMQKKVSRGYCYLDEMP